MTLFELLQLLRRHLAVTIILPVVVAFGVALVSFLMPDEYTATTSMYVLSRLEEDASAPAITQSELSASQMLTNDVVTILRSERVKADVANEFSLSRGLSGYDVDVTNSTTTRVITLSVTGTDPQMAADIANALVADTSEVAVEVMQIQSVNVIDKAGVPSSASGPPRLLYVAVGFLGGLFLAVAIVVIRDMLDTRVRSDVDVETLIEVPVIGHFPVIDGM